MCVQDVNAVVTEFCLIPTNNMQKKKKIDNTKYVLTIFKKLLILSRSLSYHPY